MLFWALSLSDNSVKPSSGLESEQVLGLVRFYLRGEHL